MARQLPLHFEFRANQTFADFFAADNQEVLLHLQHCVAGKGQQHIYLWGETGQGKSHLLQACCRLAQELEQSSFYFDFKHIEQATLELLNGLDECEVVCFDNIQVLAGKPDWEQKFFHFFNSHRDQGHKLIVAADVAPAGLKIELPDLKTRLNWGLSLKLKPLNEADSLAALIFKARKMGFEISPKTGQFLLANYSTDFKSLWELLDKLDQASLAAKRKLTIPFLKEFLPELAEK